VPKPEFRQYQVNRFLPLKNRDFSNSDEIAQNSFSKLDVQKDYNWVPLKNPAEIIAFKNGRLQLLRKIRTGKIFFIFVFFLYEIAAGG